MRGRTNVKKNINNNSSSTFPKIKWADATEAEIKSVLEAHYAGVINISDYWNIGDTRRINLSSMGTWQVGENKDGETHDSQDVDITIIGFECDDLVTPINGNTKASITVQLEKPLSNDGCIDWDFYNSYNNKENYTSGWTTCKRRKNWINSIFKRSLPSTLQSLIKQVSKISYDMKYNYSTSSNTWNYDYIKNISLDYCFLLSPKEIGITDDLINYIKPENNINYYNYLFDGDTYDYYKETSNRIKYNYLSERTQWLTRFPAASTGFPSWYKVHTNGNRGTVFEATPIGIVPAFCM